MELATHSLYLYKHIQGYKQVKDGKWQQCKQKLREDDTKWERNFYWLQWQGIGWGSLFLDYTILTQYSEKFKTGPDKAQKDWFFLTLPHSSSFILDERAGTFRKMGSQFPEAKKSFPEPSWGSSFHLWPQQLLIFCILRRLQLPACTVQKDKWEV